MAARICMGHITGDCRNPMKDTIGASNLECPYCLRENGKDGNDLVITEPENAIKIFSILKDKITE